MWFCCIVFNYIITINRYYLPDIPKILKPQKVISISDSHQYLFVAMDTVWHEKFLLYNNITIIYLVMKYFK